MGCQLAAHFSSAFCQTLPEDNPVLQVRDLVPPDIIREAGLSGWPLS
jgi:hypothetical protein